MKDLSYSLRRSVKSHPESLFILSFQALLVAAAIRSIEGDVSNANLLAELGFLVLILGVGIVTASSVWKARTPLKANGNDSRAV